MLPFTGGRGRRAHGERERELLKHAGREAESLYGRHSLGCASVSSRAGNCRGVRTETDSNVLLSGPGMCLQRKCGV